MRGWEGIREDGPRIGEIAAHYPHAFDYDADAWCAVAIIAALRKAGLDPDGITPAARSVLNWTSGTAISDLDTVREGDLAVIWREAKSSWKGHAGFFVKADSKSIHILGGNTGDAVAVAAFPRSRFLGAMRPKETTQMANSFASMEKGYGNLWAKMHVTRPVDAEAEAAAILKDRAMYEAIEAETGVPWYWIACVHARESSRDFGGVLHNGERIIGTGQKTRLVPAGRGPFASWGEAAVDALAYKGLDRIADWSLERCLYEFERYNGFGYVSRKVNSPYVWAGTSLQQRGKFVADGDYDAGHWDGQLGCAAILKSIAALDADTEQRLGQETAPVPGSESAEEAEGEPGAQPVSLSAFTTHQLMAELMSRPGVGVTLTHSNGDNP